MSNNSENGLIAMIERLWRAFMAPATPTKMELATEIYKRMRSVKDVTRKDIIEKFISEVKLTKAGASTYYQMIKDKHEPMGKK